MFWWSPFPSQLSLLYLVQIIPTISNLFLGTGNYISFMVGRYPPNPHSWKSKRETNVVVSLQTPYTTISPSLVVIVHTSQHLATSAWLLFAWKLKGHFLTELYDVISEESSLPTLDQG